MRIIAGELRGRRLSAPPGKDTRPMLDRVREALFSILGQRVPGARVLDLYSGSGSLGLESLSRGASFARMVERDPRALAVLKGNVEALGLGDRAQTARGEALAPALWGTGPYGIVFLDPPYALVSDPDRRQKLLARVEEIAATVLAPGGTVVIHAPTRELEALRTVREWTRDERSYGNSGLLILERGGVA